MKPYSVGIITICRNEVERIAISLQSVKEQTYKNKIHFVRDGCSTDNTLEVVKNFQAWLFDVSSRNRLGISIRNGL